MFLPSFESEGAYAFVSITIKKEGSYKGKNNQARKGINAVKDAVRNGQPPGEAAV